MLVLTMYTATAALFIMLVTGSCGTNKKFGLARFTCYGSPDDFTCVSVSLVYPVTCHDPGRRQ
jgi:hypothetical protein